MTQLRARIMVNACLNLCQACQLICMVSILFEHLSICMCRSWLMPAMV